MGQPLENHCNIDTPPSVRTSRSDFRVILGSRNHTEPDIVGDLRALADDALAPIEEDLKRGQGHELFLPNRRF